MMANLTHINEILKFLPYLKVISQLSNDLNVCKKIVFLEKSFVEDLIFRGEYIFNEKTF